MSNDEIDDETNDENTTTKMTTKLDRSHIFQNWVTNV